jgi:predicted DCC family thiol-disulfide oxidoreductase YuxK
MKGAVMGRLRERPVLVYDGDCGFCTSCVRQIERRIKPDVEIVPFQFTDLASFGLTVERAEYELLWIGLDGAVAGGAQAFAGLLRDKGGLWWPVGAALWVPPIRWIAHGAYRLIAVNRHRMPGGTAACALPAAQRPASR